MLLLRRLLLLLLLLLLWLLLLLLLMPAWRKLRRQILGTAVFVFVTFLLRAVFSTMNALAKALQTRVFTCSSACNPARTNVWEVILVWPQFTPEFR